MAQTERWQLSGQGPEDYEQHLVPALFAPFAASLVTRASLQLGERLLDAACGTGIVARMAAPPCWRGGPRHWARSQPWHASSGADGLDASRGTHNVAGRQPGGAPVRERHL